MTLFSGSSIGIDLGTSRSCAAYCYYNSGFKYKIIEHSSEAFLPSVVTYSSISKSYVGVSGAEHSNSCPETSIKNSKRFIGLRYDDPKVIEDSKTLPYETICGDEGLVAFRLHFQNNESMIVDPKEIATQLLKEIKQNALKYLKTVESAVVTVPAYFNDRQRRVTKSAALSAGFKEVYILDEPVAAAIAYGIESDFDDSGENILVFDLGGGTFDVSIIHYFENNYKVLATEGDSHLGGIDFDTCLYDHFKNEIYNRHNINVSEDANSKVQLFNACEEIKKALSKLNNKKKSVFIKNVGSYNLSITRTTFENLSSFLFKKTTDTVNKALQNANLKNSDINRVILVGGSSMIPYISETLLTVQFPTSKICKEIDASRAVAHGASIKAAFNSGGIKSNIKELTIQNVTSLSIGVRVHHGKFSIIVPKQTELPCEKSSLFATCSDNQTLVKFNIYQGERTVANKNSFIQTMSISVPPLPEGRAEITLTFSIDENKILTVKATDEIRHNEKYLTITHSYELPPENIELIQQEAENERENDRKMDILFTNKKNLDKFITHMKESIEKLDSKPKKKKKLCEILNNSKKLNESFKSVLEISNELQNLKKQLEKGLGKHKHIVEKYS